MTKSEEDPKDRIALLYERYATGARRFAYLLTGDLPLAEDLAHDAFVRTIGRLGHLRHVDAFEPYLRRTIVNLTRMHFRRRHVERSYLEHHQESGYANPESVEPGMLADAIRRLPLRQRTATVLTYYYDLSDVQAADVMGCAPGTIRSLVSQAKATLRKDVTKVEP